MQPHIQLQQEINRYVDLAGLGFSIELDRGSDVTDLSRAVAIRMRIDRPPGYRIFTLVSLRYLNELLALDSDSKYYCSGGPLIVLRSTEATAIVEGLLAYLNMER